MVGWGGICVTFDLHENLHERRQESTNSESGQSCESAERISALCRTDVSVCCQAGTGSSVLDPFPFVIIALLRAVRCCTPLQKDRTVPFESKGLTHTHTHL